MNASQLENFAQQITGKSVKIYKPENNLKYASYYPHTGNIEPQTKYGIYFNGVIQFDFVTGKNIDSFFKCFITQYINKFMTKQFLMIDNELRQLTKIECISKLKNDNRVYKHLFYTTLYGIGMFAFFTSENSLKKVNETLGGYLSSLGVTYDNEFSEAGWAYRFVIGKSVTEHNELLEKFEI